MHSAYAIIYLTQCKFLLNTNSLANVVCFFLICRMFMGIIILEINTFYTPACMQFTKEFMVSTVVQLNFSSSCYTD